MLTILILCLRRKGIRELPQELFLLIASFIPIGTLEEYATSFRRFLTCGFVLPEIVVYNSDTLLLRALPPARLDKSDDLVFVTLKFNSSILVFKSFSDKKDYKKHGLKINTIQPITVQHPKFQLYARFIKAKVMYTLETVMKWESKNIHSLYELLKEQTEQACATRFTDEIIQLQKQQQSEMQDLLSLQAAQLQRSAGIRNDVQQAIVRNEKKRDIKAAEIHRLESKWKL